MKRMGLAELVHPLSPDAFMANYWQKKPYVGHGSPDRFEEIVRIPELRSINAILEAWRGQTDVWAPRGTGNPVITAEAHQLPDFFESGYTIYLSRVEQHVPALEPLARSMELDLGLRIGDIYFEAFVSQGAGSTVHFDPNVTINIQLIGRKRWWMAANKHVVDPHVGWSVGAEVDEEMGTYARQPFPTRMPRGAASFEARAGTLVYLHPGYWHSTVNQEPSLSLLYTINPPTWTDLLVEEIRRHLHRGSESRQLAFGLGSTALRDEKRRRVRELIAEISAATERMDPDILLSKWGGSLTARFERNPQVNLRLAAIKPGDKTVTVIARGRRKTERIELPAEAGSVLKWIAARTRPFAGHEAARAIYPSSTERTIEILETLEGAGVLLRTISPEHSGGDQDRRRSKR